MSPTPEERADFLIVEAVRNHSTTLPLGGLGLTQLPRGVEWLVQLRHLDLQGNRISVIPPTIGQLIYLEHLDLGDNELETLPRAIGYLTRVRHLRLSRNRLTSLPTEIGDLRQLTSLRLHDNELTELPESIGELTKLTELRLTGNRLRTLPESIGRMASLQILDLSKNALKVLPDSLGGLADLHWLYIDENQLQAIPETLKKVKRLEHLFLHGNPGLNLPVEILGKTWKDVTGLRIETNARPVDILAYYFESRAKPRPLNEVKVVLVGRGGAGKSSICDRLLSGTFDPAKSETPGIDIRHWRLQEGDQTFHVHLWDFAGQEITHSTHQFFLTERSVYLLVLDGRSDSQGRDAEYWLRLIDAFSASSPVIVILNQWDKKPFALDEFALRERYPAVRAFLRTDCESGRGLADLQAELLLLLSSWKEVREPFPASWWSVKERLTDAKENYLTLTDYRRICSEAGISSSEEQSRLARILHALGIILHYGDDTRLRETAILNPHWVTSSVYTLLRLKDHPTSDGTLTLEEATAALPGETEAMVAYLLGLMRRFELCYPLDVAEMRWLVPELLDPFQPSLGGEWRAADATRLRYQYRVLPEGLMPRFIVRTYPLCEGGPRWRNGVVLRMEDEGVHEGKAAALVRAEPALNQITVVALGNPEPRLRLVKLIRNHFGQMHTELRGLDPKEELEVEGHPGTFKDIRVLELDEQRRAVTTVDTEQGSVLIDQTGELNRVSSPVARDPEQPRAKLFVSYAHTDSGLLDFLKVNLEVLKMDGLVSCWFDGPIRPSAEWDTEIRRELDAADIIVLMVSTAFLSRPYIRGVELGRAIQRKETGDAELLILVLEPQCSWKSRRIVKQLDKDMVSFAEDVEVDLGKYQALLPKNPNVERWPMRPAAFNHVGTALREMIAQVLAHRSRGGGR